MIPARRPRLAAARSALGAGCALLALCFLLAAPAAAEVRVYKVQHRSAEELLPLAQTALAGEGSATLDHGTNSLVLVGTGPALDTALELLAAQDRRLRSVVLHYDSQRRRDLDASGVHVDWSAGSGALRVGNVRFPDGGNRADVVLEARTRRGDSDLAGSVRILEGQSGRVVTGTTVPVVTRDLYGESTHFVNAESGFEVRPRILGDGRVQLAIEPFDAQLGRGGSVEFLEAASTLVLEPGRTVALGGTRREATERDTDVFSGAEASRRSDDRVLLLRVEVE